ncbi:MAG: hypothetical protein IT381_32585 [Deltaproteobacteria bacterium]|nr:hypothetical protein [Deltaproteobacteria bacterium]
MRLLQGDDREAESLLLTAGSVTVMGLRNLAFAERIRADRMRERFLVGDDEAVVRALSADPPLALRPLLMHAWLALDDATEVLARIEESDRVAGPLGLLAVDAEIDLGRCKEAHAHLLTQARDRRVAFRLKRLNAMLNEMQTEMPSDSATSCRKETP